MKNKIIIITGSSGFIGNYFLKDALKNGYKIIDILRHKNKKNKDLSYLHKKYKSSYKSIYFENLNQIKNLLKNKKIHYFINFATYYKNFHQHNEIPKFINSNILFPTVVLDLISNKVEKVINFGSMMQHTDGISHSPKNFYSSTKSAFEMILNFFKFKNKKVKFYNLKLFESFAKIDKRKKLIPTLIKNFRLNKKTVILSKTLELNIVHIEDIIRAIYIILDQNIKQGTYCLKQKKNLKIKNLILEINKNSKKNIKVKYLNQKLSKIKSTKLKLLPKWSPDNKIKQKIIKEFV